MAAYIARIERSNRKDLTNVEVQVTITDLSPGRQSWSGEFVSRSADAILPNERLAFTLLGRRAARESVTRCLTAELRRPPSCTLPAPVHWFSRTGSDGSALQTTRSVREGFRRALHAHSLPMRKSFGSNTAPWR